MMGPNFSPAGGVGTIWKDPTTGKTWKYSKNGWLEQGSGDISKDNKNKGTFVVKPEEEGIVNTLKVGGAKNTDIQNALKQRQAILAQKAEDPTSDTKLTDETTVGKKSFNPFSGKSKVDVLRDAFNNGVTTDTELEKLGKTYDLLASTDEELIDQTTDLDSLTVAEQEKIKSSIKSQVITKAQALGSQSEREEVMESLGTLETGQEIIDAIEEGISTGPIAGTSRKGVSIFGLKAVPGARTLGKTTPEEDRFAALVNIYTARFIKAISGAQVSDKEREFLMESLPSETKQEQENIEGIKAISEYLANRYSPTVGVDLNPLVPLSGNTTDPLKILNGGKNSNNPLGI